MPVFTYLGAKNVNISLFNDTLTIYPKKTGGKRQAIMMDEFFQIFAGEMDCVHAEFEKYIQNSNDMGRHGPLGVVRFVHRNDADHDTLHQDRDKLKMEDSHYHAQFRAPIDRTKIEEILNSFVRWNIFSSQEKTEFLQAYSAANKLEPSTAATTPQPIKPNRIQPPKVERIEKIKAEPLYTKAEKDFVDQLNLFAAKANSLKHQALTNTGYQDAADVADITLKRIKKTWGVYIDNKNPQTYTAFKKEAEDAIADARPALETHRGYKEVLGNLALFVALLGVGYIAAALVNKFSTGRFTFFRTDSAYQLDSLDKEYQHLSAPIPVM